MKEDDHNNFSPQSNQQRDFFGIQSRSVKEKPSLKINLETVRCSKGNPCVYVCMAEHCEESATTCGDQKCECRSGHNQNKLCMWGQLSMITKAIESKNSQLAPDSSEWINARYDQLIDWISEEREKTNKIAKSFGGSESSLNKFISLVQNGQSQKLTGKMMCEVGRECDCDDWKETQGFSKEVMQVLDEKWRAICEKVKNEVSTLSELAADLKEKQKLTSIGSDVKKYSAPFSRLDSKVACSTQQRKTVTEMLNTGAQKVSKYNMLYRASENGFSVKKYHQLCDNWANTVTLIRNENDKVIGGFTPLYWDKKKNDSYGADSALRSFIFSVTENVRLTLSPQQQARAIYYWDQYGPTFGHGYDLYICEKANQTKKSYANIGYSYVNERVQYGTRQAWRMFNGSTESKEFRVKEWEVWEVVFD